MDPKESNTVTDIGTGVTTNLDTNTSTGVINNNMYEGAGRYTTELMDYAKKRGINDLTKVGDDIATNTIKSYSESLAGSGDLLGLSSQQWGNIGTIGNSVLGLGQLGLGVMSYMDQAKTAEKQRSLLDQQLASNAYTMNETIRGRAHLENVFNPPSQGLAQSAVPGR